MSPEPHGPQYRTHDVTPGWSPAASFEASHPLGDLKQAKLIVKGGISHARIQAGAPEGELYRGRFTGLFPELDVHDGTVRLRHDFGVSEWIRFALMRQPQSADLELSSAIPWAVELRGGVSQISADLRDLQLSSLDVRGGVSVAAIALPRAKGRVPMRAYGGAHRLTVFRPTSCGFRIAISGGVSRLKLDDNEFGAIGGPTQWQSPDFDPNGDHYELVVAGGVSELIVSSEEVPRGTLPLVPPSMAGRARWGSDWMGRPWW